VIQEDKLLIWASDLEEKAHEQAQRTSRLPFITDYVALMPDAHWGMGSTIGSVIPTKGAIIPAAVGVDIGCGMIAANTGLNSLHLPDDLSKLMSLIEDRIPAGVGRGRVVDGHRDKMIPLTPKLLEAPSFIFMDEKLRGSARAQMGSLGSGNHFVEVCLDETEAVWIVLHSGSRGVGNKLAQHHIGVAKGLMKDYFISLEDPDLAYLVEGTQQFDSYIADMLWAQDYALANREVMMDEALRSLAEVVFGVGANLITNERINCHHNFTTKERHHGKDVWLTRKGAISALAGQRGVIPGSMGTATYITKGRGSIASYQSCSHGAGRRMSRGEARKRLTVESLDEAMSGKTWNNDKAGALLDEHPDSYKDIDQVMADQADLVEVVHTLHQVFNYKGA
jgi:tRNA-splicing ligase RtcB (3'-phosphate/5'-hydroxy nucleic acid ligase)